jgi:CheY-like chemotaxis protein
MKPFLKNIYQAFLPEAHAKHLELKVDCPNEMLTYTDKSLLERAVRNLLQNAIKYTNSGHVWLHVEAEGDYVWLTIADTGPGIPEAEQGHIFEEFYQIDNPGRDRIRGLGLGLAIVRRLVTLLDIEMRLFSSPGAGSRFVLKLPHLDNCDHMETEPSEPSSSLVGLHVLVVDDEAKVRLAMKELLEALGCRVSDVDCTSQAVTRTRVDPPNIILADFRLRGEDHGIAAVHAIRELYPELPALLVSGDTAPERLQEASAAGIQLLHKPVSMKVLKKAIAISVGRQRADLG